ncbi:unnamed protein product [Adineta ricciae]|uniref:G-protein coupled receptors family 1 profile domain-containing protein n=1 Tax=Adineta ricciae TaxID=249248 RepID=A0A814F0B9_ADIRI|nr:unnamed protein product [Adineta ricciae]
MEHNDVVIHDEHNSNAFLNVLTVITLVCICVLGTIGNSIVLIVAVWKQKYSSVTNCYIINLAITDLLFLLISVPLTTYLGLTNKWILSGIVSCRVHVYLAYVLLQATCYTLAVMSVDRYLYVVSSHPRPPWRTPLNALIICILIWIVSIAFIFPYTSFSSSTSNAEMAPINPCEVSAYHPFFASCYFPFCAYYILPLLVIALCYTRLFCYLRKTSNAIKRHKNSLLKDGPCAPSNRRRVIRTLVSLTCAFALCWLPIHTLEFLNCQRLLDDFYIHHTFLLNLFRVISHALSYFNSCLNPFLYALFNKDFFQ